MRIVNRVHLPWFIFVCLATVAACLLYVGNFHPDRMPAGIRLPDSLLQKPSDHQSVGGTPLGLIFGSISLGIFVFAALLGVRKKIVLWRIGTVQRWLRAHIWLTLLTIPLVILHSGIRLGGPMTTLLMALYALVMVSGIYGLTLQHHLPSMMKERLPAETVFEQIPHIRSQLVVAAEKLRDSFKPAPPKPAGATAKTDAGAPAPSPAKAVTAGSAPMASTKADLSTPTARAKTTAGSTITAEPVVTPAPAAEAAKSEAKPQPQSAAAAAATPSKLTPEEAKAPQTSGVSSASDKSPGALQKGPETIGTPTARVPEGVTPIPAGTEAAPPVTSVAASGATSPEKAPASAPNAAASAPASEAKTIAPPFEKAPPAAKAAAPTPAKPAPAAAAKAAAAPAKPAAPAKAPAPPPDPLSEAFLVDFLDRQIIPYLSARRGDRMRLGNPRYAEDTFRFVKLRVSETYRSRVAEVQAWCDERRMLDRQTKLHHWLHGWLFIHVPFSFLLLMLTVWHAFVTLFYY
jgi:hypothetical protein